MPALHLVLGFVVLQRVGELALAHRNQRALRARGAVEVGRGHYPVIVALHTAWLLALATMIDPDTAVSLPWAGIFVLLECGRAWVIATLGRRWTTRVMVLPGAAPIRSGPHRYLRHPNYVVVCGEMAVVPLMFGAWELAAVASALNLLVLRVRLRVENAALDKVGAEARRVNEPGA